MSTDQSVIPGFTINGLAIASGYGTEGLWAVSTELGQIYIFALSKQYWLLPQACMLDLRNILLP